MNLTIARRPLLDALELAKKWVAPGGLAVGLARVTALYLFGA